MRTVPHCPATAGSVATQSAPTACQQASEGFRSSPLCCHPRRPRRRGGLAALLALAPLLLAGCASDKSIEQEIRYTKPAYRIDVKDLYEAYETNQEKADKKYKGEVLLVVGNASLIQEDVTGAPYAMMNASNIGSGVQCMFAPEHKNELHAATGTLYIKGRCEGFNINVILRGCTLK